MELAFSAYGQDGTGTPLVILHGLFGSSRNWQALAKRMARSAPVFTLDLRNHGDSPWTGDMDYGAMADDVAGFLERRLGGAPAALLGHSMGGKAAMVLALREPWLVDRLLVLDIAPVRYPPRFHTYLHAMQAIPLHMLTQRSDADAAMAEMVPDPKIRGFLLRNLVETPDGWSWRANLETIGRALPDLFGFPDLPEGTRYEGPTLFLRGERSDYVMADHRPAIARLFPNAAHDAVADAAHWVHADKPEAFLAKAEAFLFRGAA